VTLKFLLVLHWVVNITQLAAYAKQVCTQTHLTDKLDKKTEYI